MLVPALTDIAGPTAACCSCKHAGKGRELWEATRCTWSGWCRAVLLWNSMIYDYIYFSTSSLAKIVANSKSIEHDSPGIQNHYYWSMCIPAPSVLPELHETLHPSTHRIKHNPHCPKNCFLSMSLLKQPWRPSWTHGSPTKTAPPVPSVLPCPSEGKKHMWTMWT